MSDKVYAVIDGDSKKETLVRAAGLQTAIAHVAAKQFTGKLLKSGELLDRITDGATVEVARTPAQGATPAPEAATPPKGTDGADTQTGGNNGTE